MPNKKYGLYKRIMKCDKSAIDEIETLEEAKEIIRILINLLQGINLNNGLYSLDFDKAVEIISKNGHRRNTE